MTATVQPESRSPSRRALLAGALGGLGAFAASAIGRSGRVRAGVDGDVVLGANNVATATTTISHNGNFGDVFAATSGVNDAVNGYSDSGRGVFASSDTGTAIFGTSSGSDGVFGISAGTGKSGTIGWSYSAANGTGVLGTSGGTSVPAAKVKTGVFGYAAHDSGSTGVWGSSPAGHGVHGESSTGWAGYFDGKMFVEQSLTFAEMTTPSAPTSNKAKLFIRDNGSGKTQLCVRFHTGATKVLATQP
jgi:hypothetical protein